MLPSFVLPHLSPATMVFPGNWSKAQLSSNPTEPLQNFLSTPKTPNEVGMERSEYGGEICVVCGDEASGKHYGASSCEGCKGFFKRSIRNRQYYFCRSSRNCFITKIDRNRCQFCRFQKFLAMGMRSESVQASRRPINHPYNYSLPQSPSNTPRGLTPLNQGSVDEFLTRITTEQKRQTTELKNPIMQNGNSSQKAFMDLRRQIIKEDTSDFGSMFAIGSIFLSASTTSSGIVSPPSVSVDSGPIYNSETSCFDIAMDPVTPDSSEKFTSEVTTRLLFLSVHFVKDSKVTIRSSTIETLLKVKWCDLFILAVMQTADKISLNQLIRKISSQIANRLEAAQISPEKSQKVAEQMHRLIEFSHLFAACGMDPVEYAYLKLISFTAEDMPNLVSTLEIRDVNKLASQELFKYVSSSQRKLPHPMQGQTIDVVDLTTEENDTLVAPQQTNANFTAKRFSEILQLLSCLRWFDPSTISDIFFSALIGPMSIETLIPLVLQMDLMSFLDHCHGESTDLISSTFLPKL